MTVYHAAAGEGPLVVSMPHAGALIPDEIAQRMTEQGRSVPDTDWHIHRLYDFLEDMAVPRFRSIYARYVVDLNRPPDGGPLYPGARETELCPTTTFDEAPIYQPGEAPDEAEVESRRRTYWQPYHLALAQLVAQAKDRYGVAVLFDAHSIRSQVPRFFEGRLPAFNVGTREGASCAPSLRQAVAGEAAAADGYDHVVDGRFKGGFITRSYGRPDEGTHAIQLELAQRTYMLESAPWTFDEAAAAAVRPYLRRMIEAARDWAWAQRRG